jgi:hypothetical protein
MVANALVYRHFTPIRTMREATFLVGLVSYMAVVIIALAPMVNHWGV